MSEIQEIQILNYRESLKLSQRAVFSGLTVSGIFYCLSSPGVSESLPKLPFLNLEFTSSDSFWAAILVIYIASGLLAWHTTNHALKILSSIENRSVAFEVAKFPNILVCNQFFRLLMAGALLGVGLGVVHKLFGQLDLKAVLIFLVFVHPPFYCSLDNGRKIYASGQLPATEPENC